VRLWGSIKQVDMASSLRVGAGENRVVALARNPNASRERGRGACTYEYEADENIIYSKSEHMLGWLVVIQ